MEKLAKAKKHIDKYEQIQEKLKEDGVSQISTTDADARRLTDNQGSRVGYNVLIASESTNKMIACFQVSNTGDSHAFFPIAKPTRDFLLKGNEQIKINGLADKGFCNARQIMLSHQANIITYISNKESLSPQKPPSFRKDKFTYDKEQDIYLCPQKVILKSSGNLYAKGDGRVKEYIADFHKCKQCPFAKECLAKYNFENKKGRVIRRGEFEDYKDENKARVENNKEKYQQRKEIVEHPFGTIKRAWGYTYTLLKGFKKITGEFALIFTAYNLRRAISELGVNALIEELNKLESIVFYHFLQNLLLWAFIKLNRMDENIFTTAVMKHHTTYEHI